MPNPMIRIHNTETNEVIDREMTDEEFDAYTTQKAIDEAKAAERSEERRVGKECRSRGSP